MGTKKEPLVSILFINWNGLEDSIECIKSCLKIDYSNYNIVLYDNGSPENEAIKLKKVFKKNKNIDFVRSDKNWGYDGGCNEAIKYSQKKYNPDYYVVANNDITMDKNFLIAISAIIIIIFIYTSNIFIITINMISLIF